MADDAGSKVEDPAATLPVDGAQPAAGLNGAAPAPPVDLDAERLANRFKIALADDRLSVTVLPVAEGRYGVAVAGQVRAEEIAGLVERARKVTSPLIDGPVNVEQIKEDRVARLTTLFRGKIADSRVTIRVLPFPAREADHVVERYTVALEGRLTNEDELINVIARARLLQEDPENRIDRIQTSQLTSAENVVTDLWPLGSLGTAGSADGVETNAVAALVEALNAVYDPPGKPVAIRDNNNLWISGPEKTVLEIKRFLSLVDASFPQVQMELWALQVSGDLRQVGARVREIAREISMAQGLIQRAQLRMLEVINRHAEALDRDEIFGRLREIGFGRKAGEPLSVVEALIFFGLAQDRVPMLTELQQLICDDNPDRPAGAPPPFPNLAVLFGGERIGMDRTGVRMFCDRVEEFRTFSEALQDFGTYQRSRFVEKREQVIRILREEAAQPPGVSTTAAPRGRDAASARLPQSRDDITRPADFGQKGSYSQLTVKKATPCVQPPAPAVRPQPAGEGEADQDPGAAPDRVPFRPNAPETLAQASVMMDRLLKGVLTAFAADLQQEFLDPLLERVQRGAGATGNRTGVALMGKSRIVVTSRRDAQLRPDLTSYVETTRPAPLRLSLLDTLLPGGARRPDAPAKDGAKEPSAPAEAAKSAALAGLAGLLPGLTAPQIALLGAALSSDVEPTYARVAPGIGIKVRPSVSPDGSAADLVLETRFGVTTEALGVKDRTDVWLMPPPDAVQSHQVTTTATVTGFELFDISSFSLASSCPQGPFCIPVLGRLPLIGPVFQWPRPSKVTHHQSIILVNAAILPRALGLLGFYGDNKCAPADPDSASG